MIPKLECSRFSAQIDLSQAHTLTETLHTQYRVSVQSLSSHYVLQSQSNNGKRASLAIGQDNSELR